MDFSAIPHTAHSEWRQAGSHLLFHLEVREICLWRLLPVHCGRLQLESAVVVSARIHFGIHCFISWTRFLHFLRCVFLILSLINAIFQFHSCVASRAPMVGEDSEGREKLSVFIIAAYFILHSFTPFIFFNSKRRKLASAFQTRIGIREDELRPVHKRFQIQVFFMLHSVFCCSFDFIIAFFCSPVSMRTSFAMQNRSEISLRLLT